MLDDERARAGGAERARERALREQAAEESTLAGTLRDLAESSVPVNVRTLAGRSHQGVVVGVGCDFCAVESADRRWIYLAFAAIGSVRSSAGMVSTDPGSRRPQADRTLEEALGYLAPERPRVTVLAGMDPQPVAGRLQSVGRDLMTVRLGGARGELCYVRLGALSEIAVELD